MNFCRSIVFILTIFISSRGLLTAQQAQGNRTVGDRIPSVGDPEHEALKSAVEVKDLATRVDNAIRKCMKDHDLPGVAIVIVRDGQTILKQGHGFANVEKGTAVDPEKTLFRIGSISKALTLLTLSRLIDDGRLKMDGDVGDYIDGIRNPYGFRKPVTMENLLTHTSGFDQIGGRDRQIRDFDRPLAERKSARPDIVDYLQANRLRRISPPGAYYRYDTYGTTLAGAIIQHVTGKPYAEAMFDEMFEPLGMNKTFVEADAEHADDLAIGYQKTDGRNLARPYEIYVTTPASSIDSTAADMGRLLEALTANGANNSGRLFSPQMAAAVLSPQFRPHPEFPGATHGLHESDTEASGQFHEPVKTLDHGGDMDGFKALMAVLPEYNIGVFVATNQSGHTGGREILKATMRSIVDGLDVPNRDPFQVPRRNAQTDLSEYVGDYYYGVFCHSCTPDEVADGSWPRPDSLAVAEKAGALVISDREYFPRGDDVFVRDDGQRMVYFGRDQVGNISFYTFSSSPDTFEREPVERPYNIAKSLGQELHNKILEHGIETALKFFADNRDSAKYQLREDEMNEAGYALLRAGRVSDAIEVFKLTVKSFPDSANAYDSLGEAYLTATNEPLARANYEKSIQLDPENPLAVSILKRLSSNDPHQVTDEETSEVVDAIASLVEQYYISLEVGKEISQFIKSREKNGGYRRITDPQALAKQLTTDLRTINGDLHMSVAHRPIGAAVKEKESLNRVDKSGSWTNYGIQELKILEGNVGYLKINHFTRWEHFEEAKKVITNSIGAFANTGALIVDVRDNGGGFEEIVAWLISYFHDGEPIHIADYYRRYSNERIGIHTTKDLPGIKLPELPIFILVNAKTGSAAESFAFSMKNLKRAILIGETTMGAGNGAMTHRVNDRFTVNISSETMLNPIVNAGFEQVGVKPDVAVASDEAFSAAYRLAIEKLKTANEGRIHPSNYDAILEELK